MRYSDVRQGTHLPMQEFTLRRQDQIRYCGAHSDFIGVHWTDRVARSVGLKGVIAHGPLVVAKALTLVTAWASNPAAVVEYDARFLAPVYVPDDDLGVIYLVEGVVEELLDHDKVRVTLPITTLEDEEHLVSVNAVAQLA